MAGPASSRQTPSSRQAPPASPSPTAALRRAAAMAGRNGARSGAGARSRRFMAGARQRRRGGERGGERGGDRGGKDRGRAAPTGRSPPGDGRGLYGLRGVLLLLFIVYFLIFFPLICGENKSERCTARVEPCRFGHALCQSLSVQNRKRLFKSILLPDVLLLLLLF